MCRLGTVLCAPLWARMQASLSYRRWCSSQDLHEGHPALRVLVCLLPPRSLQGTKMFWLIFWVIQHAWMTLCPALISLAMFGEPLPALWGWRLV